MGQEMWSEHANPKGLMRRTPARSEFRESSGCNVQRSVLSFRIEDYVLAPQRLLWERIGSEK
jgi:hypothetical protein